MAISKDRKTVLNSLIGYEVIVMLDLRLKDGRVDTTWGNKTPVGLGASIRRIVDEAKHSMKEYV